MKKCSNIFIRSYNQLLSPCEWNSFRMISTATRLFRIIPAIVYFEWNFLIITNTHVRTHIHADIHIDYTYTHTCVHKYIQHTHTHIYWLVRLVIQFYLIFYVSFLLRMFMWISSIYNDTNSRSRYWSDKTLQQKQIVKRSHADVNASLSHKIRWQILPCPRYDTMTMNLCLRVVTLIAYSRRRWLRISALVVTNKSVNVYVVVKRC